MSRILLDAVPQSVSAWSYLATYGRDTPIVGTYHVSDLPRLFYKTDDVSKGIQDRYIAFLNTLDPNEGLPNATDGSFTHWPTWQESRQLLEFGKDSTELLDGDFRKKSFRYIKERLSDLRL